MRRKTLRELDKVSKYDPEKTEKPPAVEEVKEENGVYSYRKYSFPKRGVVKGELINLRNGPDQDASVMTCVQKGSELEILEEYGNWFKVRVVKTGDVGYMLSFCISEV